MSAKMTNIFLKLASVLIVAISMISLSTASTYFFYQPKAPKRHSI